MRKQNSYKTLSLCALALVGSILISLSRVHSLEPMVASIQQEFQSINIRNILIVLIIVGTISNAFMQAWIIQTLCRMMRIKTSYLQSFELFIFASLFSLILSQAFINQAFFMIMSGLSLTIIFCILTNKLLKEVNVRKHIPLYTYGVILGALQVWLS
ncbi:hypothetical protein AOC36_00300 [Erysipelothrix larvae]|uniref:Uncharacterized protein n=1 Tax=Erysipelothrix larvae TaxID=1514105 RepID=A0A0X8GXY7_9FIRM|nr:hypothetical protein [Erysipelothrix larvae]AMC92487.1 hypothetical protein AOC36_00300 [Erysipelothrix larvae]